MNGATTGMGADASTLNFQTGYVTAASGGSPNTVTITLPNAILSIGAGLAFVPGIVQFLTNRSNTLQDTLRWYDGDPTVNNGNMGWVNFSPPFAGI